MSASWSLGRPDPMAKMRLPSVRTVTLVGSVAFFVACSRSGPRELATADAGENPSAAPSKAAEPTNGLPIPAESVTAVVNPEHLPAYTGPTGIVEGKVWVKGPPAPDVPNLNVKPCPAALDTYGKLFRAGPARADGLRPLADAVVVVTGYAGSYVPETEPVANMTIGAGCGYKQRTVAITFGQRLEIANDSKLTFLPYLDGVFQPAVMMAPPQRNGEPVKIYPPRPGHFLLLDQLHTFVREDVYVLRQPLHAVTDLDGHFRIEKIPVGSVKIGAGSPDVGAATDAQKDVTVHANVVENVDMVVKYEPPDAAPSVPPPSGPYIP